MIGNCCCCKTDVTFTLLSCVSNGVASIDYEVKDPHGDVVATGTTDGSGQGAFTARGPGAYTISTTASGRWAALTDAPLTTLASPCPATDTATATMVPATGYVCTFDCDEPLATTLFLTDLVYGAVTLTYNVGSGQWEGSLSVSYPGCSTVAPPCAPATIDINYVIANVSGLPVTVTYPTVGGGPPPDICPQAGGDPQANSFNYDSITCPPTLNIAYGPFSCVVGFCLWLYCGSATFGYTVTE